MNNASNDSFNDPSDSSEKIAFAAFMFESRPTIDVGGLAAEVRALLRR